MRFKIIEYQTIMPKIVSFIIPKGGCGKTTTAVNLSAYLALQGYRVLAVDMDPQGNLTQHFGYDSENVEKTLLQVFLEEKTIDEVILKRSETLHVVPNNFKMIKHHSALEKTYTPNYLLRDALFPIKNNYDYILIDCPPSLGLFSQNALVASTDIMLVVAPEFFPMRSIKPLYLEYLDVKEKHNLTLNLKGVVLTMADMRLRHSREIVGIIKENFGKKLYSSYIRNNVSLKEAASYGNSIFEYDANSSGAMDYTLLAEEFLRDFAPAVEKKRYYEEVFNGLNEKDRANMMVYVKQKIQSYHKYVISEIDDNSLIKQAVIIERNKQIEKFFPFNRAKVVE